MRRKTTKEMDYRELAAELARNSIVTKCLARYLEQVIEEIHDTQIKPLREAAERVVWFDWSDNDMDAVAAIDRLRDVLRGVEQGRGTQE